MKTRKAQKGTLKAAFNGNRGVQLAKRHGRKYYGKVKA